MACRSKQRSSFFQKISETNFMRNMLRASHIRSQKDLDHVAKDRQRFLKSVRRERFLQKIDQYWQQRVSEAAPKTSDNDKTSNELSPKGRGSRATFKSMKTRASKEKLSASRQHDRGEDEIRITNVICGDVDNHLISKTLARTKGINTPTSNQRHRKVTRSQDVVNIPSISVTKIEPHEHKSIAMLEKVRSAGSTKASKNKENDFRVSTDEPQQTTIGANSFQQNARHDSNVSEKTATKDELPTFSDLINTRIELKKQTSVERKDNLRIKKNLLDAYSKMMMTLLQNAKEERYKNRCKQLRLVGTLVNNPDAIDTAVPLVFSVGSRKCHDVDVKLDRDRELKPSKDDTGNGRWWMDDDVEDDEDASPGHFSTADRRWWTDDDEEDVVDHLHVVPIMHMVSTEHQKEYTEPLESSTVGSNPDDVYVEATATDVVKTIDAETDECESKDKVISVVDPENRDAPQVNIDETVDDTDQVPKQDSTSSSNQATNLDICIGQHGKYDGKFPKDEPSEPIKLDGKSDKPPNHDDRPEQPAKKHPVDIDGDSFPEHTINHDTNSTIEYEIKHDWYKTDMIAHDISGNVVEPPDTLEHRTSHNRNRGEPLSTLSIAGRLTQSLPTFLGIKKQEYPPFERMLKGGDIVKSESTKEFMLPVINITTTLTSGMSLSIKERKSMIFDEKLIGIIEENAKCAMRKRWKQRWSMPEFASASTNADAAPAHAAAPEANNDVTKQATPTPDHDGQIIEELLSRKTLTQDEVVYKVAELVKKLFQLTDYHEGLGMKLQKMIGTYYWDHPPLREIAGDVMCKEDYATVTMKMIKKLNTLGVFKNDSIWFPTYYAYNTMWNFSDASHQLARSLAESDAVRMLTLNLSHKPYMDNVTSKNVHYVLKASLSILHNMARSPGVKHHFKEHKTAEALKPFFSMDDEMLKALAMLIMSYIIDEDENAALIDDTGTIKCIITWIEKALDSPKGRYKGFTPNELVQGLDKLAVNDTNKTKIVNEGALELFHRMLKSDIPANQISSSGIIWTLSFDACVRQTILDDEKLVKTMDDLTESEQPEVRKNIAGAFWVCREEEELIKKSKETVASKAHVFISYCWSEQDTVVQIRDRLQKNGYNVWIDIDLMEGDTLDAMADGIENSAIVLVFMSEKYKQSPNCRTEAEYMFQLRKEYIPIMMQTRYRPDGWLGLILGAKLFIDFSGKLPFERAMAGLLKELRGRGQRDNKNDSTDEVDGAVVVVESDIIVKSSPGKLQSQPPSKPRTVLTKDGISRWLLSNNLGHVAPAFAAVDGKMLIQLAELRREAPEFFYQSLETKFKLSITDILRFMEAMDKLGF